MKKLRGLLLLVLVALMSVAVMACDPPEPTPGPNDGISDAAAAFITEVNALPAESALELSNEAAVQSVQNKYDALSATDKLADEVKTAKEKLEKLSSKIESLKTAKNAADAKVFIDAVNALPTVEALELTNEPAVVAAKTLYNALSNTARAVTGVSDASTKLTALETQITALKAKKVLIDARAAVVADIQAEINKRPQADFETADWTTIQAYLQEAVTALEACATVADISAYDKDVKGTVINNISNILTKAQKLQAAKADKLAEISRVQALYLQANYSSSVWTTVSGYFTTAISDVNALTSVSTVIAYDISWIKTTLDSGDPEVAPLPVFDGAAGGDVSASTALSDGQLVVSAGNINRGTATFFATYDAVESLQVNVYVKKLNETNLTYASEWELAFASKFTWTWTNRSSNSTPKLPPIGLNETEQTTWKNLGKMTYTNMAGTTHETAEVAYTAFSVSAATVLRNILGSNYKEDGTEKYSITTTIVTTLANANGCSVMSVQKNSDNAAWGKDHDRIIAATTTFDNAITAIGTVAYTQAKLDLIVAAEGLYNNLDAVQKVLADAANIELQGLRDDFDDLEEAAVDALVLQIGEIVTATGGITPTSDETVVAALMSKVNAASAVYGDVILATTKTLYATELGDINAIISAARAAIATTPITAERLTELEFIAAVDGIADFTTLAQADAANARPKIFNAIDLFEVLSGPSRDVADVVAKYTRLSGLYLKYTEEYVKSLYLVVNSNGGAQWNASGVGFFELGAVVNNLATQFNEQPLAANVRAQYGAFENAAASVGRVVIARIHLFTAGSGTSTAIGDANYIGYIDNPNGCGGFNSNEIRAALTAKGYPTNVGYSAALQLVDRASLTGTPLDSLVRPSVLTNVRYAFPAVN